MQHERSAALSDLVFGRADVLPEVGPDDGLDGELAAVGVEEVAGRIELERP